MIEQKCSEEEKKKLYYRKKYLERNTVRIIRRNNMQQVGKIEEMRKKNHEWQKKIKLVETLRNNFQHEDVDGI